MVEAKNDRVISLTVFTTSLSNILHKLNFVLEAYFSSVTSSFIMNFSMTILTKNVTLFSFCQNRFITVLMTKCPRNTKLFCFWFSVMKAKSFLFFKAAMFALCLIDVLKKLGFYLRNLIFVFLLIFFSIISYLDTSKRRSLVFV